jgi:lysophospholipase L1-like esterase
VARNFTIALLACALLACALLAPAAGAKGVLTVRESGSGVISGSGILCPPSCTQAYPRPSQNLVGFGDSGATSYGASSPALGWPSLVSTALSATNDDYAVDGAAASYPNGTNNDGGWAWVLGLTQPGQDLNLTPPPFTASILQGFNDLHFLGGPSHLGPFKQAMATMIERLDSVALFEDNSRTVSAPGGWTSVPSKNVNSGTTMLQPNQTGAPLTISVPGGFRGGTIALGFTTSAGNATPSGQAVYAVSVDGGSPRSYTIDGPTMVTPLMTNQAISLANGGGWIGTIDRLTNLRPGKHKISVALRSSSGSIASYFDYWEAEALQPLAQPIMLPLQYGVPSLNYTPAPGAPYFPTNTDVALLDLSIRNVAKQFGSNVIPIQLALGSDPANYFVDNAHPSDAGHAYIAQEILLGLSTTTLTPHAARGAKFLGWSGGCSGTKPCTVVLNSSMTVKAKFTTLRRHH